MLPAQPLKRCVAIALPWNFEVLTQRKNFFMFPAQPLKYDGATRLLDAKQNLEGVKDTCPRRDVVGPADARNIGVRLLC